MWMTVCLYGCWRMTVWADGCLCGWMFMWFSDCLYGYLAVLRTGFLSLSMLVEWLFGWMDVWIDDCFGCMAVWIDG